MKTTKLEDRRVRCKLCPRVMRFGEYADHFGRFHAFDFSKDARVPYTEPTWLDGRPSVRERKGRADLEGQLFIGYPDAPPQEDVG